jgi:hypothetical protein
VLQLRQFHLQLAFVASGALREDVENQAGAVDDAATQFLFKVALLGSGQLMIENGNVGIAVTDGIGNLGHFAFTGEKRGVRAFPSTLDDGNGSGARRGGEQLQLIQPFRDIPMAEVQLNENSLFAAAWALEHGL